MDTYANLDDAALRVRIEGARFRAKVANDYLESARGGLETARGLMNVMTGTDYDKTRAYKSFLVAEDAYNDAAFRAQSVQKHLEMLCEQMAVAAMETPEFPDPLSKSTFGGFSDPEKVSEG
jgi:hypothetical protein